MTRTERVNPSRHRGSNRGDGGGSSNSRQSQISRSLSRLLRHQAENEKVPISPGGWVKLDDLLAWRGLERISEGKRVTIDDVFAAIEEDGRTGKGRFEVRWVDGAARAAAVAEDNEQQQQQQQTILDPTSKNTPDTQAALQHFHAMQSTMSSTSSEYLIRAAQGHTMKSVQSSELLQPITLATPDTIPTTVVHGTFYGAWSRILSSGGLKPMGRNNVHFATGPALDEVLDLLGVGADGNNDENESTAKGKAKQDQVYPVLTKNKVISGMRFDAQMLIYVDLKACLEDVDAKGLDMTWWKSGNGVVLTEGLAMPVNLSSSQEPRNDPVEGETSQDRKIGDLPMHTDEPILASKSVKTRKEAVNREAERQHHDQDKDTQAGSSSGPLVEEREDPKDCTEHTLSSEEPILVSKAMKSRIHQRNLAASQPQAYSPSLPPPSSSTTSRLVPTKYWHTVVDIKSNLGIIWTRDHGVVKELPVELRSLAMPRGKGGGNEGGNRSRGGGGGDRDGKRGHRKGRGKGSGRGSIRSEERDGGDEE